MDAMGNPVCKKWVGLESPPKKRQPTSTYLLP